MLINQCYGKIARAFVNSWVVNSEHSFNVKLIFNLQIYISESSNEKLIFIFRYLQIVVLFCFK